MYKHPIIKAESIDDLMYRTFKLIEEKGEKIKSSRGLNKEVLDAKLILSNPLARLSISQIRSTPFSAFGEFFWYWSGSNSVDFISYYLPRYERESEDGKTIQDAYGPRLIGDDFLFSQISNIVTLLKKKKSSKRAIIQIFEKEDLQNHLHSNTKSIPCTLSLQFLIRNEKVHLIATMRSNDVFYGLPHDVFAFTMIQEIISKELGCELGSYTHNVGSLHYYVEKEEKINEYLDEGFQSHLFSLMPKMTGHPIESLSILMKIEKKLREGFEVDIADYQLDNYWHDIALLLKCFSLSKKGFKDEFLKTKEDFIYQIFKDYTERKELNLLGNV